MPIKSRLLKLRVSSNAIRICVSVALCSIVKACSCPSGIVT